MIIQMRFELGAWCCWFFVVKQMWATGFCVSPLSEMHP